MENISIASLALPSKTVQMEFPGMEGFLIDVNYLTKDEIIKLRKSCSRTKINRRTRQPEEVLDEEKFNEKFVEASVKGWTGLKVSYLKELMLVDTKGVDDDAEVQFTIDNAVGLVNQSDVFDTWLYEASRDLENFTKSK